LWCLLDFALRGKRAREKIVSECDVIVGLGLSVSSRVKSFSFHTKFVETGYVSCEGTQLLGAVDTTNEDP
jgi:hypothetical protein